MSIRLCFPQPLATTGEEGKEEKKGLPREGGVGLCYLLPAFRTEEKKKGKEREKEAKPPGWLFPWHHNGPEEKKEKGTENPRGRTQTLQPSLFLSNFFGLVRP